MQKRLRLLQQLVLDSQYGIDTGIVAEAILARREARRLVPDVSFRNDIRTPEVRSFRPTKKARSFRPCNVPRARDGRSTIATEYGL